MRTNIEIDDELMATALALTGLRTKRAVVDAALRALIDRHNRRQLKEAFGRYRSGKAIWTSSATGTETSRDDVGSSVWIDHVNGRATPQTSQLGSFSTTKICRSSSVT